jgi:hypothetical protein
LQVCALPPDWLGRTLLAAEIILPGICEEMQRAYDQLFIEGWCMSEGYNA